MTVYVWYKKKWQVFTLLFFFIKSFRHWHIRVRSEFVWFVKTWERKDSCHYHNTQDIYFVSVCDLGHVYVCAYQYLNDCVCVCVTERGFVSRPVFVCGRSGTAKSYRCVPLCCGADKITSQHSYFQSSAKHPSPRSQNLLLSQPLCNITTPLIFFQELNKPPENDH